MKKTIIISLVISSLLMGANTVDNLTIEQENRISSSSTINNATVHQGKSEIIGSSDVDKVSILQKGSEDGNVIDNSDIIGSDTEKTIVYQGLTHIKNSKVENIELESINKIMNVNAIHDATTIKQGNFIINDSNATDSSGVDVDIDSLNRIKGSSVTSNMDINASDIQQAVTLITNGAKVDGLALQYKNEIIESDLDSVEIYQGTLDVNSSEVHELYVESSDGDDKSIQLINSTNVTGGSIHQNSIYVSNNAHVNIMKVYTTNKIENSTLTNSNISQSEITIH